MDRSEPQLSEDEPMFGEEIIWLFVIGDMCIFSMFFWVYGWARNDELEIFQRAKTHLNIHYGSINTLVLLASSWLVVLGQRAVRSGIYRRGSQMLIGASVLGVVFAALKIMEYMHKAELGLTFETNNFFLFYYLLTGAHLAHVVCGIAVLLYFAYALRGETITNDTTKTFESGAIFWHMIDLLWIIIFSLLYLMR